MNLPASDEPPPPASEPPAPSVFPGTGSNDEPQPDAPDTTPPPPRANRKRRVLTLPRFSLKFNLRLPTPLSPSWGTRFKAAIVLSFVVLVGVLIANRLNHEKDTSQPSQPAKPPIKLAIKPESNGEARSSKLAPKSKPLPRLALAHTPKPIEPPPAPRESPPRPEPSPVSAEPIRQTAGIAMPPLPTSSASSPSATPVVKTPPQTLGADMLGPGTDSQPPFQLPPVASAEPAPQPELTPELSTNPEPLAEPTAPPPVEPVASAEPAPIDLSAQVPAPVATPTLIEPSSRPDPAAEPVTEPVADSSGIDLLTGPAPAGTALNVGQDAASLTSDPAPAPPLNLDPAAQATTAMPTPPPVEPASAPIPAPTPSAAPPPVAAMPAEPLAAEPRTPAETAEAPAPAPTADPLPSVPASASPEAIRDDTSLAISPGSIQFEPPPPSTEPVVKPVSPPPARQPAPAPATVSASAPSPANPTEQPTESGLVGGRIEPITHVVRRGETFYSIARYYYGSGRFYRALWQANRDKAPRLDKPLWVGTALLVPAPEDLDRSFIEPPRSVTGALPGSAAEPRSGMRTPVDDRTERTGRFLESPPAEFPVTLPRSSNPASEGPSTSAPEPAGSRHAPRVHVVSGAYETLRSIARQELNDPRREQELLDLNADQIENPNRLPAGLRVRLPEQP